MASAAPATILIVDDDASVARVLGGLLAQTGAATHHAANGLLALEALRRDPVDLLITDLRMPEMGGMELLRHVRDEWPDVPVVMLSAHGTIASSVEAMKLGAADFLTKPFDRDEVVFTVQRALTATRRKQDQPPLLNAGTAFVGSSAPMRQLVAVLDRAAQSEATVLICGESGTGKELAARHLHARSARRAGPFVAVNCAALPEPLLESELFGYEKGAFTGASSRKPGRAQLAEGGTLFLDEIGDLSLSIQVKLLRLLQDREYQPLGSTHARTADVRFVAATHRDLASMVALGTFREDLYYRLSVLPVRMPALRERPDDIPTLLRHFCALFGARNGRPEAAFDAAAVDMLSAAAWPGNVRQLQNFVERAVILSPDDVIGAAFVMQSLREGPSVPPSASQDVAAPGGAAPVLAAQRGRAERDAIVLALERTGGNRTLAARVLGVSRRTLYNKLAEYGLS